MDETKRTMVAIRASSRIEADLGRFKSRAGRVVDVYQRYLDICRDNAPPALTNEQKQVLLNVLSGSLINSPFIRCLDMEIEDGDDMIAGNEAAAQLLEMVRGMTFTQRCALIDSVGF